MTGTGQMETVSDSTRNLVWQGLLDIAHYTRYFGALERRYRRNHQIIKFAQGVAAIVTALPLIPQVTATVASWGAVGILVLVIWDYIYDYGRQVGALRITTEGLSHLETRQRHLWDEVQNASINEKQASRKNMMLQQEALKLLRGLDLNTDNVLNELCQKNAYQAEQQRYAKG